MTEDAVGRGEKEGKSKPFAKRRTFRTESEYLRGGTQMMQRSRKACISPALLAVILLLALSGCAADSTLRSPSSAVERLKEIKNVYLAPPDVKVYELTAGGVREQRDDWSATAKQNLVKSAVEALKSKGLHIEQIPVESDVEDELHDIQALYRAVSLSIQMHTYNKASLFPEKIKDFDYSVGSIDKFLDRYHSDALFFVDGYDEISTTGRKTLNTVGVVAAAVMGVVIVPRTGFTATSAALIDRSGAVLWYSVKGGSGSYDLREPGSCSGLVSSMVTDFPEVRK